MSVCEDGDLGQWVGGGGREDPGTGWGLGMCIYRGLEGGRDGKERESGGKYSYSRVVAGGEREMEVGLQLTIAVS